MIGTLTKPAYRLYEWSLENDVKKHKIPEHVAIIMDGNRRLADRFDEQPLGRYSNEDGNNASSYQKD